MGAKLPKVTAV